MNSNLFGNCDPGPIRSEDDRPRARWSGARVILTSLDAALLSAENFKPDTKDGRIQRRALINTLNAAVVLNQNIIRAEGN